MKKILAAGVIAGSAALTIFSGVALAQTMSPSPSPSPYATPYSTTNQTGTGGTTNPSGAPKTGFGN